MYNSILLKAQMLPKSVKKLCYLFSKCVIGRNELKIYKSYLALVLEIAI